MSNRNYLCVFTANPEIVENVVDIGQDPDFSPPCPTWGICRPQIRSRWVDVGDYIVFVGYYGNERYLVKGWFRVGEKITYLDALNRFPTRQNVIIRFSEIGSLSKRNVQQWKREGVKRKIEQRYSTSIPSFLTTIRLGNMLLIQNPADSHEIDNWKCQRMFLCTTEDLDLCINQGKCLRENEFPALKGYLVADKWCDVGNKRIFWEEIVPSEMKNIKLRTPKGQHNALRIEDKWLKQIQTNLSNHCEPKTKLEV